MIPHQQRSKTLTRRRQAANRTAAPQTGTRDAQHSRAAPVTDCSAQAGRQPIQAMEVPVMSPTGWEHRALDSIQSALGHTDPKLATLLAMDPPPRTRSPFGRITWWIR